MKTFVPRSLVLWLALALSAAAQDPDPREGLLDPARVLPAAAGVNREAYPDADVVGVNTAQVAEYAPDGTSVERFDFFAKALTEKGRRDLSAFRFGFNTSYGGIEIHRVTIFKPSGETIEVDVPRFSREMVAPGQMSSNIYDPNQKLLAVGVPGLEIGDTVRVVGTQRTVRARMADTWADFTTFEDEGPILEETYEVRAPKARPLVHRRLRDEIPGTVSYESEETETATIHRWRVRNVPRMFEEPNMPAAHTVVQRLLVSTIPDWPTVSRWYWNLSRPRLDAVTPEMREKVRELTERAADDDARLRAIFFFVAQNIQYLGITTETVAPGYEPRDVGATYEKRSGVCRDKAALLVAMLRLAGFEAFPVLISVGPLMDAEVPLPYFNHAIVAVRRPDGAFELMDPTDETTKELFPPHLNHRSYLVATPEGEPLRVSPVIPSEKNLVEIETAARLTADGAVSGVSTLRFGGLNDNAYRGYFTSIKPDERRRFFEGLVKRVLPGAMLTGFALAPENLLDMNAPLTARLEFSAPDATISGDGVALPPVPLFGHSGGIVNFALGETGLARRRYPLVTENACGVRERFELDVSAALAGPLSLPAAPGVEDKNIVWRQTLAHDPAAGRLTGAAEFRLETVEFSPAEYLDLKAALERIAFARRKRPIFEVKADGAPPAPAPAAPAAEGAAEADVEILEHVTEYDVASASEWTITETVRKKVLTFAAIRPHSVLKIPFNTGWESVEVEYARTVDPSGQTRAAAAHDINLMDAPWVASAPRYPASKLLTVSLPGVEVGGTIEYRIRRQLTGRPFFAAMESFGGHEPVAHRVVRLRSPPDLPLQIRATPGVPAETAGESSGKRHFRIWTAEGIPAIPREDAQPPVWALAPTLFISHPDGAVEYARIVQQALWAAANESEAVAAAAREIAAAQPEGRAVQAIRDAVARRVRRAGPALHEAPLSAISAADVTWREGYGSSADAAVVLAAMLRAIGEKNPEFVLAASVRPAGPAMRTPFEVFQPSLFPDALVRVPRGPDWIYLNDTDQYAPLGAVAREGAAGLATAGGAIETLRPPAEFGGETRARFAIAVEPDGAAILRVTREYRGPAHGQMAKTYAELSPEERRRRHQELVAEIAQDAAAEGDLEADFTAHPGRETFAVRIPRFAVADGPFLYFSLPAFDAGLPRVRSDARRTPLYWDAIARQTTSVAVVLPAGYARAALMPPAHRWAGPGGRTETAAALAAADGTPTLTVQRATEWQPAVFAPEAYAELLETNRLLTHPRTRFVLLRKGE